MSYTRALTDALEELRRKEDDLSTAMGEVERIITQAQRQATDDTLADLQRERAVIAKVLATFYCAPLSMSSIAPLLELAEALNPWFRGVPMPDAWKPFVRQGLCTCQTQGVIDARCPRHRPFVTDQS